MKRREKLSESLSSERSKEPPNPLLIGRLAQLGERLPYKQDVGSSILSSPTNLFLDIRFFVNRIFLLTVPKQENKKTRSK
ncbi:hypothetical protein P22_0958 [Propionispora sp. 2/2-37]|nr:hypothetical protein P22_0958 [Propionispora sp. 2/2-37]